MKRLQTEFIGERVEVTQDKYYEMLEALPPERMAINAFLVGEPTDHIETLTGKQADYMSRTAVPRFAMYFEESGKFYYAGLSTIKSFETFLIDNNQ